jgi:hypothetical protein
MQSLVQAISSKHFIIAVVLLNIVVDFLFCFHKFNY